LLDAFALHSIIADYLAGGLLGLGLGTLGKLIASPFRSP
jgi:hypothetical protein